MLSEHQVKPTSSSYSSLSSHIQASFAVHSSASASASSAAPGHLDLQFNSSDPYNTSPEDSRPAPSGSGRRPPRSQADGSSSRGAGRDFVGIVGGGNSDFPPPSSAYPSLSEQSQHPSSGSGDLATAAIPHPLSLTHKIAERRRATAALKEEEARRKELQKAFEVRRELRNSAFAEALGLSSQSLMQNVRASSTGIHTTGTEAFIFSADDLSHEVLNSLSRVPLFSELLRPENPHGLVHLPAAAAYSVDARLHRLMQVLRRPLYSTELVAWAKSHRADLLKTERSIQELLEGEQSADGCGMLCH